MCCTRTLTEGCDATISAAPNQIKKRLEPSHPSWWAGSKEAHYDKTLSYRIPRTLCYPLLMATTHLRGSQVVGV